MIAKIIPILIAGMALVGSAEAQPVPGGLPDVDARIKALQRATTSLQGQVSALQGQIGTPPQGQAGTVTRGPVGIVPQGPSDTLQSQVTALQESNSSFRSALNAEILNRFHGDSVLDAGISQEIDARKAGDAALQAAIAASSKGFSTYKVLTNMVAGTTITVSTIGPLPAGSYRIVATAGVGDFEHDAHWDCQLVRDDTGAVIGRTFQGTNRNSFSGTSRRNLAIPALVTLPDNATVRMTCFTPETLASVDDIQIVATSVGTATVECADILACQ